MSQGLFTAASGIASNQAALNVIADNIANMNTVAFKSTQINFETMFARQLSAGSAPSEERGGINPMEIGLGCAVSEVGRNFSNGSVQTTGRTTDLSIQGDGFFTVQNADNRSYLTRAGNFSMDANGYLVTPSGLWVIGNESLASVTSSNTRVQVPIKLNFVTPNAEGTDLATDIGQETGSAITTGTFTMTIDDPAVAGGAEDVTVTIAPGDTLQDVVDNIQAALRASAQDADDDITVDLGGPDGNQLVITTPDKEIVSFSGAATDTSNFLSVMGFANEQPTAGTFTVDAGGAGQTVTIVEGDSLSDIAGKIQDAITADGGTNTVTVSGNQISISAGDAIAITDVTSNFAAISGLAAVPVGGGISNFDMQSASLVDQSQVTLANPDNSDNTRAVTTYYIGNDGALEVTYSNGAKLSVLTNNSTDTRELKYTSASGRVITGSSIDNNSDVVPAQLQLQLATVINPKGLNVVGGNLFSLNSIAGEPSYAIPGTGGLGIVKSGALEASNVDLPSEFSNMILAQRAIEANSRAFSTVNQIMQAIVNLGR